MPVPKPSIYLIAGCNGAGNPLSPKNFSRATVSFVNSRRNEMTTTIEIHGLKPIPESKMSPEARVASQAHRRATRKKRVELRRRGLPMIIWKDGRVREVPA